jgi:cyanophycinase
VSPSPDHKELTRGFVVPIGGAEERAGAMPVLSRFVELCGGSDARLAIIPTASNLPDTGDRYVEIFKEAGVGSACSLAINDRADASDPVWLEKLEEVHGIFITGGNQLRLSTILGGTEIAKSIRRLNASGIHVAGTSAGAAFMPQHMITGGMPGVLPQADGVNLAPGIGLTNTLLIDQHFSQRNRLGRLLTAISYNPFLIGVGIDEDTALFVGPDQMGEVVGSGSITIVDPDELSYTSMSEATKQDSLSLHNLKLHILSEGCRYDVNSRTPYPPAALSV